MATYTEKMWEEYRRKVLHLYLQGWSVQEIAKELNSMDCIVERTIEYMSRPSE